MTRSWITTADAALIIFLSDLTACKAKEEVFNEYQNSKAIPVPQKTQPWVEFELDHSARSPSERPSRAFPTPVRTSVATASRPPAEPRPTPLNTNQCGEKEPIKNHRDRGRGRKP